MLSAEAAIVGCSIFSLAYKISLAALKMLIARDSNMYVYTVHVRSKN